MSIVLHGFTAGKGIAIGRAHLILRGMTEVPQYNIIADELAAETTRFDNAIKASRRQLEQLRSAIPENAPTELGGQKFPAGLVFDSRLWNPLPPPAEWEDTARDLQHLPVMKTFRVPLEE